MCVNQFYAREYLIIWLDKICIEWNLRIYSSVCVLNLKFSNRLVLTTQVYCSKMMNNLESFTCTPVPRIPWFYFSFTFVVYNLCHKKKVWNFFLSLIHWWVFFLWSLCQVNVLLTGTIRIHCPKWCSLPALTNEILRQDSRKFN